MPPTLTVQMPAPIVPAGYRLTEPPEYRLPREDEWFIATLGSCENVRVGDAVQCGSMCKCGKLLGAREPRWIIVPLPAAPEVREVVACTGFPLDGEFHGITLRCLVTGHGPSAKVELKDAVELRELKEKLVGGWSADQVKAQVRDFNELCKTIDDLRSQLADAQQRGEKAEAALTDEDDDDDDDDDVSNVDLITVTPAVKKAVDKFHKRLAEVRAEDDRRPSDRIAKAEELASLRQQVEHQGHEIGKLHSQVDRAKQQVETLTREREEAREQRDESVRLHLEERNHLLARLAELEGVVSQVAMDMRTRKLNFTYPHTQDAIQSMKELVSEWASRLSAAVEKPGEQPAVKSPPAPVEAERRVVEAARKWKNFVAPNIATACLTVEAELAAAVDALPADGGAGDAPAVERERGRG